MKIGFDDTPAAPAGTYSQHLARLLAKYAPEHEYIIDGKRCKEFDLYHGFRPGLPFPVLLRRIPCVMTVHNLNFLRYPHLYSLGERLVLLRLYRRMLRSASRVITVNRDAREELSDRLRIDPGRIEVVMPLAARMPQNPPDGAELEGVRAWGRQSTFVIQPYLMQFGAARAVRDRLMRAITGDPGLWCVTSGTCAAYWKQAYPADRTLRFEKAERLDDE